MTFNYQINQIADREFGRVNTPPANYYIGLLTALPNADGTGVVEVSSVGTGYARQLLPNNKTVLTVANNGQVSNVAQINFPAATANWGTVVDVAIFDSLTGGNILYDSPQTTAKPYDVGDIAFFDIGDVMWTVQNII
jgi:hypothetical protein